jgi:hypothetical protein
MVAQWEPDAVMLEAILFAAKEAMSRLGADNRRDERNLTSRLVTQIRVLKEEVQISMRPSALLELASLPVPTAVPDVQLTIPVRMFRRAREVRLSVPPEAQPDDPARDPALIKLIAKSWEARKQLFEGSGASLKEVAAANGYEPHYFSVLVKLGFLAPDLMQAVLKGEQPEGLTRQRLARIRNMPVLWEAQRALLAEIS